MEIEKISSFKIKKLKDIEPGTVVSLLSNNKIYYICFDEIARIKKMVDVHEGRIEDIKANIPAQILGSKLTCWDLIGSKEKMSDSVDINVDGDNCVYDLKTDTGFYGEVPTSALVDGETLAHMIDLTAGVSMYKDEPWLKFFVGKNALCNYDNLDKILFVSKKPYRCDLSWDDIDAANAVYGSRIITIDGNQYRVRLPTGAHSDPAPTTGTSCSDDPGTGSEWNDLIYRVHQDIPRCSNPSIGVSHGNETDRHGGPQVGNNWANYSDNDLNVYQLVGDGSVYWCQETDSQLNTSRVIRGFDGIATYCTNTFSYTGKDYGWRPVLELIK